MSGLEFRFTQAERPLTDAWQRVRVAPRGDTSRGASVFGRCRLPRLDS